MNNNLQNSMVILKGKNSRIYPSLLEFNKKYFNLIRFQRLGLFI